MNDEPTDSSSDREPGGGLSMVGYDELLSEVVDAISNSRAELVSRTNSLAVELFWQVGRSILARQENVGYGGAVVEQLAVDLSVRFPGQRAWAPRNLWYMRRFASAWSPSEILHSRVQNLSWTHHRTLLEGVDDHQARAWYAETAHKHRWSVRLLAAQIRDQLYERRGQAPSNLRGNSPGPSR